MVTCNLCVFLNCTCMDLYPQPHMVARTFPLTDSLPCWWSHSFGNSSLGSPYLLQTNYLVWQLLLVCFLKLARKQAHDFRKVAKSDIHTFYFWLLELTNIFPPLFPYTVVFSMNQLHWGSVTGNQNKTQTLQWTPYLRQSHPPPWASASCGWPSSIFISAPNFIPRATFASTRIL